MDEGMLGLALEEAGREIKDLQEKVANLEKDAQAVVDAVKRLEWRQESDEDCHRHCPDCGAMEPMDHYPECEFGQALRRWDARKN